MNNSVRQAWFLIHGVDIVIILTMLIVELELCQVT